MLVLLGPLVGQPGLHHQDPPGYRFFASGPCRTASGEVRYIDAPCNSEGQPRDGVATWLVQDNATTFGCARMCDVEPACTAFEINGCRRRGGACAGKCFLLSHTKVELVPYVGAKSGVGSKKKASIMNGMRCFTRTRSSPGAATSRQPAAHLGTECQKLCARPSTTAGQQLCAASRTRHARIWHDPAAFFADADWQPALHAVPGLKAPLAVFTTVTLQAAHRKSGARRILYNTPVAVQVGMMQRQRQNL